MKENFMPTTNRFNPVAFISLTIPALLLVLFGLAGSAQAQDSRKQVTVITHVDILGGGNVDKGTQLLKQFVADSHDDPGFVRFEILQDAAHKNHFTLVEVWRDEQSFDAHENTDHTKHFRTDLFPILGSPFDQRVNRGIK
jgi:quinol monooxygenase YgiN